MPRQISVDVQVRNLNVIMKRLSKEQQLSWIITTLSEMDPDSLVMGKVLDCLQYLLDKEKPPPEKTWELDGTAMSDEGIIEMCAGYQEVTNAAEAVAVLREQGFNVRSLLET